MLPNPLVLGEHLLNHPTPTLDRDRPVSRRSKPSSRSLLAGEQSDTLGLLRLNDRKSRHRRIKKQRRYERLAATSQLSLWSYSCTTIQRPFQLSHPTAPAPAKGPSSVGSVSRGPDYILSSSDAQHVVCHRSNHPPTFSL